MKVFGKWLVVTEKGPCCAGFKTKKQAQDQLNTLFKQIDLNKWAGKDNTIYSIEKNNTEY